MKSESGKITCDGFEFEFPNAIDVFVFDETNKDSKNFHGLSHAMKAVDLIVEFDSYYLFLEVKDFHRPERYRKGKAFNCLVRKLKYKYRDTWLYRWAEQKVDKPIKYFCLLELENALISRLTQEIRRQLPLRACGPRWKSEICNGSAVLNLDLWNKRYTKWPVRRLSDEA